MMQLIAKLHGIQMPGLVKGAALLGLLSSGVVIAHLIAFSSTGLFVMLRGGTRLSLGNVIFLTVLSILSIFLLSAAGFLVWSSRRGKLQMRDRIIAGLKLRGDEEVLDVGCGNGPLTIGFLGNEFVAVMQIRVGNRIGSAALVADGLHARTDGLTSLAMLIAAGGAWLGFPLVDPIIGLLIGVAILFITWDATKRMWYRLMDAVEPEIMDEVETAVSTSPNVQSIQRLRLRWVGHQLHGDMQLSLAPTADATETKYDIRHTLHHEVPKLTDLTVELV